MKGQGADGSTESRKSLETGIWKPGTLSRVHAVVISRGAAESAESEAGHDYHPTSATRHPTVTDQLALQLAFLRVSASPREPVPAFSRMVTAQGTALAYRIGLA